MPLSASVLATRWPPESGCGNADRSKFIRCIEGRDPKVHRVWIWGDDVITTKVYPTAQDDVNPWITRDFATNYFTETGSRTAIFVKKSLMEFLSCWALLIH